MAERLDELSVLIEDLEATSGERVVDRYFFLVRLASGWEDHPFEWEPFRDLAGALEGSEGREPIVLVSLAARLTVPVEQIKASVPHVLLPIDPELDAAEVATRWIREVEQHGGALPEPTPWFLEGLGLSADDVPDDIRRFLGVEATESPESVQVPLSASVRSIAGELPAGEITAFDLAAAVARRHPEYAGGRLGTTSLTAPTGAPTATWETWRDSVAKEFDPTLLPSSRHEVIDGRLFLAGLAVLDPALRAALGPAWAALVTEIDEQAISLGTPLATLLGEVRFAHGYHSDRTDLEDQLGITDEVNALCAVLTDRRVDPPLAVGLFGQWGSGKSFFMERMRKQIAWLTTGPTRPVDLDVVQIRFNAWHYADTTLWANLAIEIFERLVDPEPVGDEERDAWLRDKGDPHRAERERLLVQLETYRHAREALDAERRRLVSQRDAAQHRRTTANERREQAVKELVIRNEEEAIRNDPTVRKALDGVAEALGFRPAVDELGTAARELRTTAGSLPAVWRKVEGKGKLLGLLALLVLAVAVAPLLYRWGAWIAALVPVGASLASTAVAGVRQIGPAADAVKAVRSQLDEAIAQASLVASRVRVANERARRLLDVELAGLDREIDEATQAIAHADEQIATTTAEIQNLTVGRQLYGFLADRAAGYQKHQGIIGMLHRDFRFLDAQLRALRDSAPGPGDRPRIDRVILYIDDLDRCSPDKVLEVLEAVHLLLATELFVVVVGVDPRWLQRSLRHQHQQLVTSGDVHRDPYLREMPIEYLEKIFQIPFTLPEMADDGFARLIGSLTRTPSSHDGATSPPSTSDRRHGTRRRSITSETPGGNRAPTRALLRAQPGSAAAGGGTDGIDLTREELDFAARLRPLISTPRAAKRLMNTYRLIRATQDVGPRGRFLGTDGRPGEFQAVLTLLAVIAGYPTVADRVLVALEADTAPAGITTWSAFVDQLSPGDGSIRVGRLMPADLINPRPDDPRQVDADAWANLWSALKACTGDGTKDDTLDELGPYTKWGRLTARFSFTT